MSENPARAKTWVHRKKYEDGTWLVDCSLCGNRFKKKFRADQHDDAQRSSSDYIGDHLESPAHLAAIAAYRREVPDNADDGLTIEEMLLRSIFGEPSRSSEQRRRAAAKLAANRTPR